MLSGRVLASRLARDEDEAERPSPRSRRLGVQPASTASFAGSRVQGWPQAQLPPPSLPPASPRTLPAGPSSPRVQPTTPTAKARHLMPAPSSPFPPTPPRLASAPAPSLGREMSQTDPLVLEALLPLLSPASGGSASESGQPPSLGVAGEQVQGPGGDASGCVARHTGRHFWIAVLPSCPALSLPQAARWASQKRCWG